MNDDEIEERNNVVSVAAKQAFQLVFPYFQRSSTCLWHREVFLFINKA